MGLKTIIGGGGFDPSNTAYGNLTTFQRTQNEANPATTLTYPIFRANQTYNVTEFSALTTSGTCSIQLYKNGAAISGAIYAVFATEGTPTAVSITLVVGDVLGYQVLASPSPATPLNMTVTVDGNFVKPLSAGTASTLSMGDGIATVMVTTATSGTPAYTYQWYRSTTSGFTPGGGNIVTGATATTLNDTGLVDGTTYYYVNIVTDSGGATATSNQTSATPFIAAYFGPVATSTMLPTVISTTASNKLMTRKAHYMRDNVTAIKLAYPNWSVNTGSNILGGEVPTGNSITVNSWVEYPSGTYTPILFSGSATATIASFTTLLSDYLNVSIPNNTKFWTWSHITGSGGNNFPYLTGGLTGNPLYTAGGEAGSIGTTGVPSSPGAITDNGSGRNAYFPCAILGMTTKPTFYLLGDSRVFGAQETADASADQGILARSVGPTYAYINGGVSGDRLGSFFFSRAMRMPLINYCSVVIDELGSNEFYQQTATITTMVPYKQAVAAIFNGKKYNWNTLDPITNSTDQWATTTNQINYSFESARQAFNTDVRTSAFSIPFCDTASITETNINPQSGFWIVNGTTDYYTPDGLHPTNTGSLLIESSAVVNPTLLSSNSPVVAAYPSITGVSSGTIAYGTGKFGQALSGGFSAIYGGIVPGCPPLTMECWAMTSTTTAGASPCGIGPVSFVNDGSGNLYVRTSAPTGNITTTKGITDGVWHHLAVTMDNTCLMTIYCDGISVGSASTNAFTSADFGNSKTAMGIRYNGQFAPGTGPWTGSVDEVAIWNYIKYTGNFTPPVSPYAGTEPGLVGLWHLDGNLTGIRGPGGM